MEENYQKASFYYALLQSTQRKLEPLAIRKAAFPRAFKQAKGNKNLPVI